MDRTETSRCLAKVLAYVACGQLDEASRWARKLIEIFRDAGLEV